MNERIPVAYLTHKAWFCGHEFYVDERVLVPRSPIGELIENRFAGLISGKPRHILDMRTGSGYITIACAFLAAEVDLVDISTDALAVAEQNIEDHHEPELGLAAGSDGLKLVRRILARAPQYLSEQGVLICEVGNSMVHMMEQYPDVPFTWLELDNGGDGVSMMTRQQIVDAQHHFSFFKD